MEVVLVSLLGILAFGGVFLLLGPEWWSSSRGVLKDKHGRVIPKGSKEPRADK